ncbi:MAG: hypothetical protein Q9164_004980 [Protoblastenia rupestris]
MVLKDKDCSACTKEVHGSRDGDNEEGQEEQEERGEEDDYAETAGGRTEGLQEDTDGVSLDYSKHRRSYTQSLAQWQRDKEMGFFRSVAAKVHRYMCTNA